MHEQIGSNSLLFMISTTHPGTTEKAADPNDRPDQEGTFQLESTTACSEDAGGKMPDRGVRVRDAQCQPSDRGRAHHDPRDQPPDAPLAVIRGCGPRD